MRVLVAFDGSASATAALDLVRGLAWPDGTRVKVVRVVPSAPPLVGARAFADIDEDAAVQLASAVGRECATGVAFETHLAVGDVPADTIVREADDMDAELIVTGHRGHGAMATVFLGSVARDVTEHARRPVLVARGTQMDRIVLADDGSEGAFRARQAVATWPIFTGKRVDVVSVAHAARPLLSGVAVGVREEAREARTEAEMEERVAYGRLAKEAADELQVAGLSTSAYVRTGDPAERICELARDRGADLIVLGTRGRGAVGRVLLGSVARAVLLGAHCSVLVVPR